MRSVSLLDNLDNLDDLILLKDINIYIAYIGSHAGLKAYIYIVNASRSTRSSRSSSEH